MSWNGNLGQMSVDELWALREEVVRVLVARLAKRRVELDAKLARVRPSLSEAANQPQA